MFFGPVRDPNVLVRSVFWIFRSRFFSPVRDPDFGPDFLVNRSADQIFLSTCMFRVYVRVLNKYSSRIRLRSYSDLVRSSLFPVLTLFPSFSVIFDDLSCELRYSKLEENLKFVK